MCKHKKIKFIGQQDTLLNKKSLNMFNCLICNTTLILKNNSFSDSRDGKSFIDLSYYPVLKLKSKMCYF